MPFRKLSSFPVPEVVDFFEEHYISSGDSVSLEYVPMFRNADGLPDPDLYTLEHLLDSGIPPESVPCGNLFNPSNPLDASEFASLRASSILDSVDSSSSNENND